MPDYYYELRRQQTAALEDSALAFARIAAEFADLSGRHYDAVEEYRLEDATARSSRSARRPGR